MYLLTNRNDPLFFDQPTMTHNSLTSQWQPTEHPKYTAAVRLRLLNEYTLLKDTTQMKELRI